MLTNHVTTLEQSRKLYELGFRKPSLYKRQVINDMKPIIVESNRGYTISGEVTHYYPAYLLSEIITQIPYQIFSEKYDECWLHIDKMPHAWYFYYTDGLVHDVVESKFSSTNPVTASCDLLIWCIENGFISTK